MEVSLDSIYERNGDITQANAVKSVVCVNYACMGVWFAFITTDVVLILTILKQVPDRYVNHFYKKRF